MVHIATAIIALVLAGSAVYVGLINIIIAIKDRKALDKQSIGIYT